MALVQRLSISSNKVVYGLFMLLAFVKIYGVTGLTIGRNAETCRNRDRRVSPPLNAEFLFHFFMSPQNVDAILGDLEERYRFLLQTFSGRRRANFWYWFQTFISLRPIVWAAVKKPLATAERHGGGKGAHWA